MNKDSERFRRKRRDAVAGQLLEAAETVIARVGYEDVTMGEIARAAGCATGTLYLYFKDKQQLVTALVERHGAEFRERVRAAMEDVEDPLERIRRATRSFLEYFAGNRNYFKVLFGSNLICRGVLPGALPKSEQEERRRLQEGFLETIRQAQSRGQIRRDFPADEVQRFMRGAIMGLLEQLSLLETLPPVGEILDRYWSFLTGGIGASPSPSLSCNTGAAGPREES
jgi:AcrR family transcriptional regulator